MSLELIDLQKRYTGPDGSIVPIVSVKHFQLDSGQQVALVGSSGSGKTTLLHLIAGILAPDSGQIIFDFSKAQKAEGVDYASATSPVELTQLSEAQRDVFRGRHMGYIFQTHHLLPGFTALENVLLGMSFTGRKHDRHWAEHLLTEVGLADRLHYKPEKLSVGQQQRVAVARALANKPRLVLADEPTGALDVNNAQQVLELVRKLCEQVQASLLLVTHDPKIASQMSRTVSLAELNQ